MSTGEGRYLYDDGPAPLHTGTPRAARGLILAILGGTVAVAVAMAVSSGAEGLEAVALSSAEDPTDDDLAVAADLPGRDVVLWHADPRGQLRGKVDVRART